MLITCMCVCVMGGAQMCPGGSLQSGRRWLQPAGVEKTGDSQAHSLPLMALSPRQRMKLVAPQRGPPPPSLLWPFLSLGSFVPFLDCSSV